ncbi:ABC transporter ATP-binding protein [Spirochaeta thermophila]|uniref:Bacitracin ABC transporter, ATP-binding protein n=1 Tax=Winmispira thermophila (strain ATCC 49972 / DSM 6192 / RI 19.B1) TaxID=665571 RepID=E0RPW4_WINT6|nr:ABC transporter ATP-binding protein [Spirochaeta thermophila]ADN02817.1 bacitracin ABC transporter, ATP-binding protein [Spirochaeta thermophila DSM 6192]
MTDLVNARGLGKRFRDVWAVRDLDLVLEPGTIFGFVGLNGAGKTTTIRMLLGMIRPTTGSVSLFGKPLGADPSVFQRVGALVEQAAAYPLLTAEENLRHAALLKGLDPSRAVPEVMEELGLLPYARVQARHLSQGNRQRLALAKAFLGDPRLLLLDEPGNGLDPAGIVELRAMLRKRADEGAAVLVSSHMLDELSRVADHIGIIHRGRMVAQFSGKELDTQVTRSLVITTVDDGRALAVLRSAGYEAVLDHGRIVCTGEAALGAPERIAALLVHEGVPPRTMELRQESLEALFMRLIGQEVPV